MKVLSIGECIGEGSIVGLCIDEGANALVKGDGETIMH